MADDYTCCWTSKDLWSRSRRELITIDMIPDDILLDIFDFYVRDQHQDVWSNVHVDDDGDWDYEPIEKESIEGWQTLTHVCRRWRSVVFQSPRRLNLQLLCTHKTRAGDMDVWPPLPLVINGSYDIADDKPPGLDNIIAALEHDNRVCQIDLGGLTSSQMGYITDSAAMQKPFPELTYLSLGMYKHDGPGPILPDSFLGGTVPQLQLLIFIDIPFPGLLKLLLSATHLVGLICVIPCSEYFPPEAIATSLSALTNLESLCLFYQFSGRPFTESRCPHPRKRSILPSLTAIGFSGTSGYLEEILARIEAPRLNELNIIFFNQIKFDTPQLVQFISRRSTPWAPKEGHIAFNCDAGIVKLLSQTPDYDVLTVEIPCMVSEWRLSSLEQVCTLSLPPISTLEDLYIFEDRKFPPRWHDGDDVENMLWLELFHPFASVKNLYLCEKIVPRIAAALQEPVRASTTKVMPTLENIFLEGLQLSGPLQLEEGIEKFAAARRLTGHPVAVSRWDKIPEKYEYDMYSFGTT